MTDREAVRHAERVLGALHDGRAANRIADSWRRCIEDHRLDPVSHQPPALVSGAEVRCARGYLGRLLHCASEELDRLYTLVREVGYHVLMTDLSGVVIERRVPDSDETGCRKWCLWTGAVWREEIEGTNGVGTCLIERRPVIVHRSQHFRHRHTALTCIVAPLYDTEGQIYGALDASSIRPDPTGHINPLVLNAVVSTARRIERRSFHDRFANCFILALPEGKEGESMPLLAIDGDRRVVGATHAARKALGIGEENRVGPTTLGDILFPATQGGPRSFADGERMVVAGALAQSQGNVTAAASFLGVSRATLHRKIRQLGLMSGRRR